GCGFSGVPARGRRPGRRGFRARGWRSLGSAGGGVAGGYSGAEWTVAGAVGGNRDAAGFRAAVVVWIELVAESRLPAAGGARRRAAGNGPVRVGCGGLSGV